MTVETELKLHVAPEHLSKLKRNSWLRSLGSGRAQNQKLYSIYLDSPALELRSQKMALRLRRIGRHWVQTLKGGGNVHAGLHQRNEWETPVSSEQLDLPALKSAGGKLPHGVAAELQPIFVTDFTRTVRMLEFNGALIELGMDSGEIRAGESHCPISEIELELKSGHPAQLFQLAIAMLDIVPMTVELTSKAEYGYMLFSAGTPAVIRARFPSLKKNQSAAVAMRDMLASSLAHIQSNVPGALLRQDEEYLHQVRVGLRRLQVVLSLTRRISGDETLNELRAEVGRLCKELGRSREWDVFVKQTLAPICHRLPEHTGLLELLAASEQQRMDRQTLIASNLGSTDFQRLILRFGAWLYRESEQGEEIRLDEFAQHSLSKRRRRVSVCGNALQGEESAQLHALRIACKKLRYSIEVFESLFPAEAVRKYLSHLAGLQEILGTLNDISVAHRLLDELDNASRHDTLTLVRGWLERDYAEHVAGFQKAWKHYAAQKSFWE